MSKTTPPPTGLAHHSSIGYSRNPSDPFAEMTAQLSIRGLPPLMKRERLKIPKEEEIEEAFETKQPQKRLKHEGTQEAAQVGVTKASTSLQYADLRNQFQPKEEPVYHPICRSLKQVHPDPLKEPSPLGLSLRKSPSLLDLIQMKLTHNLEIAEHGQELNTERDGSCVTINSSFERDRLKAANFPAKLLKIGTWECSSHYEGDLVAKCYYAKRKLVWEILESGLKSKIEIQWSDITALRANCLENQKASLDIEISRPPLFFKETNPQPRKHTSWQASSDFTGEQATICRHYHLEFSEGVLERPFKKMLECDERLKFLSKQAHLITDSSFFKVRMDMCFKPLILPHQMAGHLPTFETLGGEIVSDFNGSTCRNVEDTTLLHMSGFKTSISTSIPNAPSPSSVIDAGIIDEGGNSDIEEKFPRKGVSGEILAFPPLPELEEAPKHENLGNLSVMKANGNMALRERRILDEISLHLLGEPYAHFESFEGGVTAASLIALPRLHREANTPLLSQELTMDLSALADHGDGRQADLQSSKDYNRLETHNNCSFESDFSEPETACPLQPSGSCGDLLYLPRIASLPQLFTRPHSSARK